MKKKAALVLALALILNALMPMSAFADSPVALSAELSATTMIVGAEETVSYEIKLPTQSNVNNLQLEISYDTSVLEATATQTLFGKFNSEDDPELNYNLNGAITPAATANETGKIILAMAATKTISETGGSFCRAKFKLKDGVTAGQTSISVTVVKCETGTGENTTALPCTAPADQTITITKPVIPATGITVTPETATVVRGSTTQLTAELTPENATSEVTWISSNEEIATVDESGVVTGVKAGTATITAKVSDEVSDTCEVTVTNPAITGELTVSGNAVFGETLTASLPGYDTDVTYTWYRQDTEGSIATGAQYTIVPADVGKTLTVKATHPDFAGEKIYTTAAVTKATQNAPDAPVAATVAYASITLKTVAGCEYSMDGETWQLGATFSNLTPGTEYTFYIRKGETDTHLASPAASATIRTQAYDSRPINFTVKLNGENVTDYGAYVTFGGDTFLTGTEEGTVIITPAGDYYLSGVNITDAESKYIFGGNTDQPVQVTLKLVNPDVAAAIEIDLWTKTTPTITFKNDGEEVETSSLTKDYDGKSFALSADCPEVTPELNYYPAANRERQNPLEQPPVDAGSYVAVATVKGSVTCKAAEKTLNLTINKISAGTAAAPQISNITTNGFTYTTVNSQKYIVTENDTAPDATAEGWTLGNGDPVTLADKQPGKTYYVHTFLPGDKNHTDSDVVSRSATTAHTYAISVAPEGLNFFARVGSNNVVEGQKITITNTGSGTVKIALSALTNFDVIGLSEENATLASGAIIELTVVPKSALDRASAATYSDTLTVSDENGKAAAATVNLTFNVVDKETVTFTNFADKTVTYGESYNMETAVPTPAVEVEYEYWRESQKLETKPTAAGTYTVKVRVPDTNADYAGEDTATLTINQKELTITGIAASNKVYDGTVNAESQVSGGTLSGIVSEDVVGFKITDANFNSKDVNTASTVAITAELTGNADVLANYTLTQPAAVSAKITPKPVTLTVTAEDKVYDGTTDAAVAHSFNAGDILDADASSITVNVTSPAFADAHAGNGKTVTYTVVITGDAASNYAPTYSNTTTANITPKPVTVAFSGEMVQTYDGNAKTVTATVNGKLDADTVPVTVLYNGSAEAPTLAGSYVLTATLGNADYKLADAPYTQGEDARTLTIAKGTLVPTNASATKTIAYLDTAEYTYDLAQLFGTPVAGSFTQKSITDTNGILAKNTLADGKAAIALAAGKTVGQKATVTYTFTPSAENTYNAIDLSLTIEVGTETVEKVEIVGVPTTVEIGTALTNISLKVTYKSGRTETFDSTQYAASGYSVELKPENIGTQTLKLEATSQTGTHSATANITVTDVLTGIEMEAQPAKTEYTLGAAGIDLAGGKVKATYKSTATKSFDLANSALKLTEVTAVMMRELGSHTVNVSYTEGGVTKQTSFVFTIVSGAAVNPGEGGTGPVIGTDDKFQTDPNDATTVVDNDSVALEITQAQNQTGIDAAIAQEYPALVGNTQSLNMAFQSNGQAVYAQQAVTVQLPYPAGTERADSFMVYLYQNGTLTPVAPTKSANHLSIALPAGFSASDVVLGWTKYVAPETEQESAFDRAQDRFWGDVLRAVAFADAGEVLTVDAGYFDKMPVEIMNAVNVRNVTLVIRWRNGEDIVIGRANALIPEANRLYYPLSYLLRTLTKLSASGSGNIIFAPQTGDGWEITDWSMGMFVSPLSATQQSGNAALITLMDESSAADLTWLGMLLLVGSLGALCAGWYVTNRKKGSEK